jgi:hypothetical protein
MRTDLPDSEWNAMLENFETSAWRWEQQAVYLSDLATGWPDRWRTGDLTPPTYIAEFSADTLTAISASGRSRVRVRLVDDPPTWFQEWADWAADLNRAAGEVIHRLPREQAQALDLEGDPLTDWWLIDDRQVLLLRFAPDGELQQIDLDDAPETVTHCRRVRDTAMKAVSALR